MRFFGNIEVPKEIVKTIFNFVPPDNHTNLRILNTMWQTIFNEKYPNYMEFKDNFINLADQQKKLWRSEFGKEILKGMLIKPAELDLINANRLQYLSTEYGFKALSKKLFTVAEINQYSPAQLKIILTEKGIKALEEKQINPEMSVKEIEQIIKKTCNENSPEIQPYSQKRW